MRTLMAAAAAAALFVSGAALAASADGVPASEPGQPQLAPPHKIAARHRDHDVIGDRETAALNSLAASGYTTITDVRPDGENIAADARKPGAGVVHLTVAPDGTIDTAADPAT